jgi:hypothetical protein
MAGPYDNMNPELARRLQAMIAASGGRVSPGSGYRSYEQQAALYRDYVNGVPGQARAAPPGKSNHNHGMAMDLRYSGDGQAWVHANAERFGLFFPMDDEPWHIEMLGGDDAGGGAAMGQFTGGSIMYDLNYTDDRQQDPQEVLANRLHAVTRMLGADDPIAGTPGVSLQPVNDPAQDVLMEAAPFSMDPQEWVEAGQHFTEGLGYQPGMQPGQDGQMPFTPMQGGGTAQDPNGYGAIARQAMAKYGWGEEDYQALVALWNKESGDPNAGSSRVTWNPGADNPTSTAFGIAQFLDSTWRSVGARRTADPRGQIDAGEAYIAQRYGNPRAALQFHLQNNWY